MTARSRAVVFDFGAVLFQWQPALLLRQVLPELAPDDTAARALAADIFQSLVPESDWSRFDRGEVDAGQLSARIAARTGIAEAALRHMVEAIPSHLQVLPDSVALLRRLRAAGHRAFYLSNMPRPYADFLERSHPFLAEFEDGLFSGRVGLMKPQPELYALAEQRFALDPARTLFLDDHAGNVAAARQRGWNAVQFTDAARCTAEIQGLGWLEHS